MAYDFSPMQVIRSVGFVSPKPSENFHDDGNSFAVFYYQGDRRLKFVRWIKGQQGSSPETEGELLGFDDLGGDYSSEAEIVNTLREDYPDLANDYKRFRWTGSLGIPRSEEDFRKYLQNCALLGRRLQRYLDGKDPYGKDDDEIAGEHLKELWTEIRDQGTIDPALDGYEFQLSRKDPHTAWFTGAGRGNWFTLIYDPVGKLVNVSKKRIGSVDIAEADTEANTAKAVVKAVADMIDSRNLGGSQRGVEPEQTTSKAEVVDSSDGFTVEVVESGGRLRVQGDDGVHGPAWVRFPTGLRTKAGQKYKVDQLKWNGKNYTVSGYINFTEDNGRSRRISFTKLLEDSKDSWNKEALEIDKENTERVLAGLTGEDPLEEGKDDGKLSDGIDVDRMMKQLDRLKGKKQMRDVVVEGPGVRQVSEPDRVARDHTNKTVKLSEDAETDVKAEAKFSIPFTEAFEILSMLSSEQIDKLVVQFDLGDEDQSNIIDILTDYVDDAELEKIKEDPEGYLAIEVEGEEELEEGVQGSSLRDVLLLTEDVKSPSAVMDRLMRTESFTSSVNDALTFLREDVIRAKKLLNCGKTTESRTKLTEAVKQFRTKVKGLFEDTGVDPEAVLSDSDAEFEASNDIDIVDTEDKVILDMTTEEGKQEAFSVLVDLIPDEGITVEVEEDDGSVESYELTKTSLGSEDDEGVVETEETEELEESKKDDALSTLSELASETGLKIDDKGKVTSGQPVKTIKAKVAKFNKAHKSEFQVNYDSETDSIVIS